MFEDILIKNNMNISNLSARSGVGYNYIFKIVKNQTDFNRCGLETAKKIADALNMDLNELYSYKETYFEKKIYYQDQNDWDYQMFGELNAELNKLFLIAIEYHFSLSSLSRSRESCKRVDFEISCIKCDRLSEETKCLMVAILNQQKKLADFVKIYNNLTPLLSQKPLGKKLFISKKPYNIFPEYSSLNIAY